VSSEIKLMTNCVTFPKKEDTSGFVHIRKVSSTKVKEEEKNHFSWSSVLFGTLKCAPFQCLDSP